MASKRGFNGDLGSFRVADFPDHDDVWVLAQNGAQGIGKGKPDVLFRRDLIDAGNLKFHRVFDGDDVVNRIVEFVQRGIKRGGLARTGRASDENQSVRRVNGGFELPERIGIQPSLSMLAERLVLSSTRITIFSPWTVGKTETRRSKSLPLTLTRMRPSCGRRRSAMSRLLMILKREANASCICLGGGVAVQQHAVHAITQAHHFFKRLKVNVTGPIFDGLNDDQVGELDDRSFLTGGSQLVEVHILDGFFDSLDRVCVFIPLFLRILDDVLHRGFGGVQSDELVGNGFFRGDEGARFQVW